jgi:DNA-binding CsgD family transcriptional regulator
MAVNLLERDRELAVLSTLLDSITAGQGRIAVVSGEAGIGKTSLVELALGQASTSIRTLWGACEALFTPRPLGPLYDIAQQTISSLRDVLVSETNRAILFATVLDELAHAAAPTVMVIEDIHWADEATLDLIKYLGRRVHRTPALLILTYRDDEIDKNHPLRLVLGDLPTGDSSRLHLRPLSEVAVAALAERAHRPGKNLYSATGGNPFFLTEVLASDTVGLPASVSDAVLARVARRSPEAQRLLDAVAVSPGRIERWVVAALDAGEERALEECLTAGILRLDGHLIAFRHELARQAVERALSSTRRQALNTQMLHALLESEIEPASLAQLAHHAAQAEDAALVLRFAPEAARHASAQGAHREAAAHYQTALRYAESLDSEQQAELLEGYSQELYLNGYIRDAVQPGETALALWRTLDQTEKIGHSLRILSRLGWFLGDGVKAEHCGLSAVEILETLPPSHELAMAYANMAHLRLLQSSAADTLYWAERAIQLAERIDDSETLAYALNTLGCAQLNEGNEHGWVNLEHSLSIALEHDFEEHVQRSYANLTTSRIERRQYAQAAVYIKDGIAYCAEHDMGSWEHCLQLHQATIRLNQGDWSGAAEDATTILTVPWADSTNRRPALIILASVRLRRGDPGAEALLDEARDLALANGASPYVAWIAAVCAEWRWLQGDSARCAAEAEVGLRLALQHDQPWSLGEAAIWLWRVGAISTVPAGVAAPFALEMAGDWRAAAALWESLGCPYEQALALLKGDEGALRTALTVFERLGAHPAAEITRQRLREGGVRGLPRGPRLATQLNPYGLTPRQLEILLLLAEGLHNSEIAERLSTTPKTVEHHVSAVLAKLGARSRSEAVSIAHTARLNPKIALASRA